MDVMKSQFQKTVKTRVALTKSCPSPSHYCIILTQERSLTQSVQLISGAEQDSVLIEPANERNKKTKTARSVGGDALISCWENDSGGDSESVSTNSCLRAKCNGANPQVQHSGLRHFGMCSTSRAPS